MSKTELINLSAQAFLRGIILRKQADLPAGHTFEYERTPLGAMLEAFLPFNGYGHNLTNNIKSATAGLSGVVVSDADQTIDGKVRVTITGQ